MHLMFLIMLLPLLGIILFFFLPLSQALPSYLAILAFSGFFYVLMFRVMKKRGKAGPTDFIGETAEILTWRRNSGTVFCRGGTWEARSEQTGDFRRGVKVRVVGVEGLTLVVALQHGAAPQDNQTPN
jgi:membrane-bound ClpP family serine protease